MTKKRQKLGALVCGALLAGALAAPGALASGTDHPHRGHGGHERTVDVDGEVALETGRHQTASRIFFDASEIAVKIFA